MADEKLKAKLGLDNSEFKRGLKDSENQLSKMNAGFSRLGVAIGAAFSVTAVTSFVAQGVKLAATIEGVRAGFDHIAKPGLLNDLRIATRGAASDMQLMQTAVQASNFQIPLEQLASLLKFASARAIQTGQSVEYLTQSIILGIGRKSPLILDNLGISAVRLREVLKGAGVEMSTVGDIATAVGKIASEELTKMGDVANTAATSLAQIAVAWQELKTQVGQFVLNSGLKGLLEDVATSFEIWNDPDSKWFTIKSQTRKNLEEYRKEKKFLEEQQSVSMYSGGESAGGPLEMARKQIETIASLNEKLKFEKELLEGINIADQESFRNQIQIINALEKRIKSLTEVGEARKDNPLTEMLLVPKGFTEASTNSWQKLWDDYAKFQKVQNNLMKGPEFKQPVEDMTDALMLQGEAINILTNSFDTLFTSAENGFANMVETMIDGMKRLVAEYLAKAVIFGLIRALFPGSGLATMATQNLWNMGLGGKATGGLGGFQSQPMNVNVVGAIKGKDIALALRRNG